MDDKKIEDLKNKVMSSMDTDAMSVSNKRLIAAFIDLVSISCVMFILMLIPAVLLPLFVTNVLSAVFAMVAGVLVLLKDGPIPIPALSNQSIGKKAMHIKVTKPDGKTPISFGESIQRNILMSVPYFMMAGLAFLNLVIKAYFMFVLLGVTATISLAIFAFEIFTLFKDLEGRRWGDKRADTMVILE